MAVIRPALPDLAWTPVPNAWLRDPGLPPAPKAYLAYLLSHAAGYRCSTSQAARDMGVGRDTVTGWNRKLVERGYFVAVEQQRSNAGRWAENDYTITSCTHRVPPVPLPDNPAASRVAGDLSTVPAEPGTVEPRTVQPAHRRQGLEDHPAPNGAGAGEQRQLTLVDEGPTVQQRAQALAREHYDAVGGLVPFMGVLNVVRRALGARGPDDEPYSDDQVRAALGVLRERGRPVTLQTIGAALTRPQTVGARSYGAGPYRDPAPEQYEGGF